MSVGRDVVANVAEVPEEYVKCGTCAFWNKETSFCKWWKSKSDPELFCSFWSDEKEGYETD